MASGTIEEIEAYWSQNGTTHDSRIPLILAVEIPVITLTVLVVALRFYVRTFVKKALGADDWVMGLATMFAVTETTLNCVATRYGTGRHAWDIYPDRWKAIPGGRLAYVYAVLFTPAVVLAKISICMTYLRIFPKKSDRWFCKACIAWLILSGVVCTITIMLPCIPIEAYWDLTITDKKCYNARLVLAITSGINTTTDLAVFLWPAPRLFSLRLPLRQRLGLIFVFSIGVMTCAAGIARVWYIATIYYSTHDTFYNLAVLYVLSSLDCNLGILCGSLPEIRVLFSFFTAKTAIAFNTTIRGKPPSRPRPGAKLPRGVLAPNAYDLEKSIRPAPSSRIEDDLRNSTAGDDSRQVSIQVMLDESVAMDHYPDSVPGASTLSSVERRPIVGFRSG